MFVHPEGAGEIRDRERVLAVRREVVIDHRAAARAERQAVTMHALRAAAFDGVVGGRGSALPLPSACDATFCAAPMYWSMNDGETCSAVATLSKPSCCSSRGSSAVGVDVEAQEVHHRVRVLAAIQAMQADAAHVSVSLGGGGPAWSRGT